jgi:hypothetical protein
MLENLPHEINERQIAGLFLEPDADLAEAERPQPTSSAIRVRHEWR